MTQSLFLSQPKATSSISELGILLQEAQVLRKSSYWGQEAQDTSLLLMGIAPSAKSPPTLVPVQPAQNLTAQVNRVVALNKPKADFSKSSPLN